MKIFTDGSCLKNPGPGGCGVVVMDNECTTILYYISRRNGETTNNIQELTALVYAFAIAKSFPKEKIIIYSDSAYAIGVFTQWAKSWENNNWTRPKGQEIKNLDLIKKGYQIFKHLSNCEIQKVDGHAGNIGNELADALATDNQKKFNEYISKYNLKVN